MPVFRRVTAPYQQRDQFAEVPDPVDGTLAETLDDATVAAVGTYTDAPPVVEDETQSHGSASSIQWNQTSFHRPAPLQPPKVRVTGKPKVLVDVDEEELIALGVL